MIFATYKEKNDLTLYGSKESLSLLLTRLKTEMWFTQSLFQPDVSWLGSYDCFLEQIRFEENNDALHITVESGRLTVMASSEGIDIFVSFLELAIEGTNPSVWLNHIHLQYYEGNEYVDSSSVPLVIIVFLTEKQLVDTFNK